MIYRTKFGVMAVMAIAALMALAATSSATTLTKSSGETYGTGTVLKASSEGAVNMNGTVNYTCQKSTMEAKVTNAGGAGSTVSGAIESLTFTECGNHTITVVNPGSFQIHTDTASADGNGILRTSGTEVTVLTHSLFLGTRHCIYISDNTESGVITGSKNRSNGNALIGESGGAGMPVPQAVTDALCGNDSEASAVYAITTPAYLDVD